MSRPQIEILVHIAAPARAIDDTNYRTLAAAYLNFEPTSQACVVAGEHEAGWGVGNDLEEVEAVQARSTQGGDGPMGSQDLGFIQSPPMSFRSAVHNAGSFRVREQQPEAGTGSQDTEPRSSWQPPPSVVEDSMPDNGYAFDQYCTPTRILQHYTTLDSTQSVSPASEKKPWQAPPSSQPECGPSSQPPSAKDDVGQRHPPDEVPPVVIPLSPT
ncbi:hypothetical protein C8A05DRAFT_33884, partial [Staphylotrichum tortipilum]